MKAHNRYTPETKEEKAIVLKKQSIMITNSKKFNNTIYSPSRDKRNIEEKRYAKTEMRDSTHFSEDS